MKKTEIPQIAKNAHEVVRAYCKSIGEVTPPHFEDLKDNEVRNLINAVKLLKHNPRTYAGSVHDNWISNMISEGWVYSPEYNEDLKQSPELVSYRELSPISRAKDKLFHEVVKIGHLK